MKLNKNDILKCYNYCKENAKSSFNKGNYEQSLEYIRISAHIAYIFNWIYCDIELEQLLNSISEKIVCNKSNFKQESNNRIVFYDSFSYDNRALTQQYMRALISFDCQILYMTESYKDNPDSLDIFKEFNCHKNIEVFEIPRTLSRTDKIQLIYDKIIEYNPGKLFMHIFPYSVSAVTTFYALPKSIIKYQINLTDHAFWLGSQCLDYSLEFRSYGCTLSKVKRGLSENQLLLQPFYPILSESEFLGFPIECTDDKVVIFSGGAFYKIFGENDEFFKLVKELLDSYQNVILLFAGAGDAYAVNKFIKLNGYEKRFLLLGHRHDINEVFKHCDIYLGTFPISGGLMSQYAAINGKPILNYYKKGENDVVEDVVCQCCSCSISYNDKSEFLKEANRLITDKEYRLNRGNEIKKCLISVDEFNASLKKTIYSNINQNSYNDIEFDFEKDLYKNLEVENLYQNNFKLLIVKNFGFRVVLISPKVFLWFVKFNFSKRGLKKLSNSVKIRINKYFK